MGALQQFLISKLQIEYDRLFLWSPILFSLGIGVYFSLSVEPWLGWGLIATAASVFFLYFARQNYFWRVLSLALLFITSGYTVSQVRAILLATPMIHHKVKNVTIEGTILQAERRPQDQRITLEDLHFDNWPKREMKPNKIRISVRHKNSFLQPGQRIQVEAVLLPARGPIADGAFDFAYRAYFEGLGAVGFATKPPVVIQDPSPGALQDIRHILTMTLQEKMPGVSGAVAAALITGDRSGIPNTVRQQFADSGIAHILAISGLHLSIIAGLVFLLIRRGMCLIPKLALNLQTKKWAAALSILIIFGYLLLCGIATPALRSFYMTSLVMIAIILDRAALTLRNVALAALFILFFWPELLFSPSFQLSFAAVTALIAGYEKYRRVGSEKVVRRYKIPQTSRYLYGIVVTTLIASLATTPYVIYTFNRFPVHSIEANLVVIPLTTFWIMPAALFTVITLPLGLADYPIFVFEAGINILIEVATQVSSWPASVILVPQIPAWVMVILTLSLLWMCIWRTPWRWAGLLPFIPAAIAVSFLKVPDIFISKRYGLIALREGDTLWLNNESRGHYVAETWQQLAGLSTRKSLVDHPAFSCDQSSCLGKIQSTTVSLSRHWQSPLSACANVMLSLSTVDSSCSPTIEISEKDIGQDGTHGYQFIGNQVKKIYRSHAQKRYWSN